MPHISTRITTFSTVASATVTSIAQHMRLDCNRLLSRISCHFLANRHENVHNRQTTRNPAIRQTIQTDYISTISSLVEHRSCSYEPATDTNNPNGTATITSVPTHIVHDAQSENFGLYALKCNRSGRGRGKLDALPTRLMPPLEHERSEQLLTTTAQRQQQPLEVGVSAATNFTDQVVIKKHTARQLLRPPFEPLPRIPPHRRRAPQPHLHFQQKSQQQSVAADNCHAVLELDAALLDPLLCETVSPLSTDDMDGNHQRVAIERLQDDISTRSNFSEKDALCIYVNSINCGQAEVARNRAIPPLLSASRSDLSVSIFASNTLRSTSIPTDDVDVFEDFAAELRCSPIVTVAAVKTKDRRTQYVEQYESAFSATFSEEDGVQEIEDDTRNDTDTATTMAVGQQQSMTNVLELQQNQNVVVFDDHISVIVAGSLQNDLIKSTSVVEPSLNSEDSMLMSALPADKASSLSESDNRVWAASAAAVSAPPYSISLNATEQRTLPQMAAAFTTCSPILEALDDEENDYDEDDDIANNDKDINDNSIYDAHQRQEPTSSRHHHQTIVSSFSPLFLSTASARRYDENTAATPATTLHTLEHNDYAMMTTSSQPHQPLESPPHQPHLHSPHNLGWSDNHVNDYGPGVLETVNVAVETDAAVAAGNVVVRRRVYIVDL